MKTRMGRRVAAALVCFLLAALAGARALQTGPGDDLANALYGDVSEMVRSARSSDEASVAFEALEELATLLTGSEQTWAADLYASLGSRAYSELIAYQLAADSFLQASHLYARLGAKKKSLYMRDNYASSLQRVGKLEDCYRVQLSLWEEYLQLGDPDDIAEMRINIANTLMAMSKFAEAIQWVEPALPILRSTANVDGLAMALNTKAIIHRNMGDWLAARATFDDLATLAHEHDHDGAKGWLHAGRGNVYLEIYSLEEALQAFRLAREYGKSSGRPADAALAAANEAHCLALLGRYEEAASRFEEAFENLDPASYDWPDLRFNYADLLAGMGQLDEAEAIYKELLDWSVANMEFSFEADARNNLAGVYESQGKLDLALDELERGFEFDKLLGNMMGMAGVEEARGGIYYRHGDLEAALHKFDQAGALLERFQHARYTSVGETYLYSIRTQFIRTLTGIVATLSRLPDPTQEQLGIAYRTLQLFHGATMFTLLGEPHTEARIPAASREEYEATLQAISEVEYRRLGHLAKAASQRGADRSLSSTSAKTEIARLDEQSVALHARIREIEENARASDPAYASLQYPEPSTFSEIQEVLSEKAALIEYVWTDEDVCAFVISADSVSFTRLASAEEAAKAIETARASITRMDGLADAALRAAGDLLVLPAIELGGRDKEHLLFAPDGDLCLLPIEAVRVIRSERESYLVESFDVSYVHSGSVFRQSRQQAGSGGALVEPSFVGFGNPTLPERLGGGCREGEIVLGRLPGAAEEVLEIARLLARGDEARATVSEAALVLRSPNGDAESVSMTLDDSALFLGERASESVLKSDPRVGTADILHLACHGLADANSPDLSRLFLASDAEDDGVVSLREFGELDLTARLVTLSACETNSGKVKLFEGVTGFARAALKAGARAVMSTLWRVDDAQARKLMGWFYGGMIRDGHSPARALAAAKRTAIDRRMPTSTWSAYVLWDAAH